MKTLRLALALGLSFAALHALELPTVFSDHMVLQRAQPLPVWGRADAGAQVRVEFGKQSVEATADAQGNWLATLAAEPASAKPATLRVRTDKKEVVFQDVLVGEVWLCSGQSNMQLKVNESRDGDLAALGGADPLLRFYTVDRTASPTPRFSAKASWTAATPATIAPFSAVGFHFGATLRATLNVPVGLISASWGATPAIAWTRPSVFDRHPLFLERVAEWEKGMLTFPERHAAYLARCAEWNKAKGFPPDAPVDHWTNRDAPKPPPYDPNGSNRPGNLANGMLATVAPYALRGAIWYQGENDTEWVPEKYDERLRLMVDDWRVWWRNPALAFGVVQLAAHAQPTDTADAWPLLRESQRRFALADPHAGLVAALDVGEANDIHPWDKHTVGLRLARWALADVYEKIKLRGGPEPVETTFAAQVEIRFTSTGAGLWAFDGPDLRGFTLAGPDGVFHPATAEIKGKDRVVVRSPAVPEPAAVRYAWARNPRGANLANRQRQPAPAFELTKSAASSNANAPAPAKPAPASP